MIDGWDENAADDGQDRDGRGNAGHRLVVYGTLAPGRPNHSQLTGLDGRWSPGQLRGRLVDAGWGASLGYPGLVLGPHTGNGSPRPPRGLRDWRRTAATERTSRGLE